MVSDGGGSLAHLHCPAFHCLQATVVKVVEMVQDKDDDVDAQLPNPALCPLQHPSSSPWSPLLCQA